MTGAYVGTAVDSTTGAAAAITTGASCVGGVSAAIGAMSGDV